jgi:thiamine-monophosphate kinase
MELRQLGEWGMIHRIKTALPPSHRRGLLLGLGDDAAVIRASPDKSLLLTTDLMVEGVDFDLALCPYEQIGYKALAVNLSDIAAMGGLPLYFLVSLALPPWTSVSSADQLYRGMLGLARRFKVALIGGDVSSSRQGLFLNLVVAGEIEPSRLVRRAGARVGDQIFVTGTLGDSRAGLEILKSQEKGNKLHVARRRSQVKTKRAGKPARWNVQLATLINRHLYPMPRLREGRLLATKGLASAMMDLSDGLAGDLRHLCEASCVGALINLDSLPISPSLSHYAGLKARRPSGYALKGGEDFELLFTVSPKRTGQLVQLQRSGQIQVTRIGVIRPRREGISLITQDGKEKKLNVRGYEHFCTE